MGPDATWTGRTLGALAAVLMPFLIAGCGSLSTVPLPAEQAADLDTDRYVLLARFAQICDAHVVDEESPARLTVLAGNSHSAWRPQEAYSTQLLDGTVRAVNKWHVAVEPIDFVIHTGDATDNAQLNELRWFVTCMDGGLVDPLSGVDDRREEDKPAPWLDPHAPFDAQGLYRQGVHGDQESIPWYSLVGNHDVFAAGIFLITNGPSGRRTAPLPMQQRLGLFLPLALDPLASLAYAPVSPAHPEPATETRFPVRVAANPNRRFVSKSEFVEAHLASEGMPPGHGFASDTPNRTWYSANPVPGVRLIALDSATPQSPQATLSYAEGAISLEQLVFLKKELEAAQSRGEWVVLATHHPRGRLLPELGSWLTAGSLAQLLSRYPCVALHISGHTHDHAARQVGHYIELVTGSLLDGPQQGRMIELWQADDEIAVRYRFFSHLDDITPGIEDISHADLFADPLRPMRDIAAGP